MKTIIAFTGRIHSGKTTMAKHLMGVYGFSLVKFANPLKEMLRAMLRIQGCPETEIERYVEGDLKEAPCKYLNGKTMRHAMQTLGTDWSRNMIDEDIWVSAWSNMVINHGNSPIVVDDMRFPNEAISIKNLGGVIIRVYRNTDVQGHESEKYIDSLKCDYELYNTREIEIAIGSLDSILETIMYPAEDGQWFQP